MSWETQKAKAEQQVTQCVSLARQYVLPWWGATLKEFQTPILPDLLALYIAHESAMKWRYNGKLIFAPARHVLTNYPEVSLTNLTCKAGDNEVQRLNVHPFHVRSHIWAAQHAFWEGVAWVEPQLKKYGYYPFAQLGQHDQNLLLLLQRSVGIGCTRGLLRKGQQWGVKNDYGKGLCIGAKMASWLASPGADTTPFDGSQTTADVQLRFAWCAAMILRRGEVPVGLLSPSRYDVLVPPVERPVYGITPMPKDFMVNMKVYRNVARREGPMQTGPWAA